jgi:hypothetical protein
MIAASLGGSASDIERLVEPFGYEFYAIESDGLRRIKNLSDYQKWQFNAILTTSPVPPVLIA